MSISIAVSTPTFFNWTIRVLTGLLALASLPVSAAEQYQTKVYGPTSGWSWSAHVDRLNIDKKIATEEGVDPWFTAVGGAGEYYFEDSDMILSLGLSMVFYDDNEAFSQVVRDYWGYGYYDSSDATGGQAFIEYGPQYRFGAAEKSFFSIRAGLSSIFFSSRSISGCSNCFSEDINVDGGAYGALGVGHRLGPIDLGLHFYQYFGGDLDNGFRVKISSPF